MMNMKTRFSKSVDVCRRRFGGGRRWLLALALTVILIPGSARAAGVTDIISLLKTITSTIQGAIGGALGGIQTLHSTINNFRQQVLWPITAINQAKGFVNSTRAQYSTLMFQIQALKNNSATLANPTQLESLFRNGQAGSIGQLDSVYHNLYLAVPPPSDARLAQRNMIDMDDALAEGSLKAAVLSDQTTNQMLTLADSIERQSAQAAPGSGPMLAIEGEAASLETQAYLAKMLAAQLREEAGKLAHQNALLKQSAANTRNLQNQIQEVLTHP